MNFYFVKIIFEHCCAHILQKTYFFGMHREGGKTTGRCLKIFFVFFINNTTGSKFIYFKSP